jgi:hypothetical protein
LLLQFAAQGLYEGTLADFASSYFLELSPSLPHCFSFLLCFQLPLSLALLHVSYPTAVIIFSTMRMAPNNTIHKMWKCGASYAASIEGLNELTCISCDIFLDLKVFRNSVKVYLYECGPLCFFYSIKYKVTIPPPPHKYILQTTALFIRLTDGGKQLLQGLRRC